MTTLEVIAIDGAAGSGKSTLARGLAETLGLPYVNTGIMYRALTLAALDAGLDPDDGPSLAGLMSRLRFGLSNGDPPEIEVEGSPASQALESERVEAEVSHVARHPQVRALMREVSVRAGTPRAVVEGRDIGTVVFPDAPLKFFLIAGPGTRRARRAEQRSAADRADVEEALPARRPGRPGESVRAGSRLAIVLDTSRRSARSTSRSSGARSDAGAVPVTGALPKVAVVGRQNVGKSTLVTVCSGAETIADEMPGVTRDRVEVQTTWGDRTFALVDTGGYTRITRGIESLVAGQADRAAAQADLILLIVDAQAGVTEEDAVLAKRLRRSTVPVLVVANKVDGGREEADVAALYALGLGEPVPVSALHGRGAGALLDRVVALLPEGSPDEGSDEEEPLEPRFALVGRPNVGKSSIFNALVGEERSVVYREAGTTRDSVDTVLEWPDGPVRFVDTAGMRRQTRVSGVEYYGFLRATRAIERADVAIVVIEAPEGFTSEDKKIVVRVLEAGRGLLIAAAMIALSPRGEGSNVQEGCPKRRRCSRTPRSCAPRPREVRVCTGCLQS